MSVNVPSKYTAAPAGKFLAEFFEAIGAPALWRCELRLVAWAVGSTLNSLRVYAWSGDLPSAPRITRIAVNGVPFEPDGRELLSLGFRRTDRPVERRDLRLELTVLDEELADLAPWLALVLAGRMDRSREIPASPIEIDLTPEELRTAGYGWSVAARDADRTWRAAEAATAAHWHARRDEVLRGDRTPAATGVR